jgi:spore coat protein CotH
MKARKISIVAMILAVLYSALLLWQAAVQSPETSEALLYPELEYEERIFDPSRVHTIDIQVSAADWGGLKKDALSKECIDGTVTINGETLHHVGVRTKGNSTLLFNAAKGWDRFSLVLEFDAFQESQRYYGLDCLSLYNNMFDASTMKTYLCYEMMRSMGVPTPLCSFVAVHVNGEFLGIYAASELFSESFALRNFGYDYGQIYKPEQFDIAAIMTGEVQNAKIDLAGLSGDSITRIGNNSSRPANISKDSTSLENAL